jgi:Fur family ferric uptake transcriptional regulator
MHLLNDHTIIAALKDLGVNITQNRIAVLKVLMQCTGAVSVANIRKLAHIKLDRVSVYRTLQEFLNKGFLQVVPSASGIPHYTITAAPQRSNRNGTAFFICTGCGISELLNDKVEVRHKPSINKQVSRIKRRYVVFEGLCNKCQP